MDTKKTFKINKLTKKVLMYGIGIALCGFALGLAVSYFIKINLVISSLVLVLGLIIANIYYNKI